MEYRVVERPSGQEIDVSGWQLKEEKTRIFLEKEGQRVGIELDKRKLRAVIKGEGKVAITREGKMAYLSDQSQGEIQVDDEVWIATTVTVKIVFVKKEKVKKDIFVSERRWFDQRVSKELNLILGAGVLAILIGIIVLGYQKRSSIMEQSKFESVQTEFKEELRKAQKIREQEPDKSLELAEKAVEKLKEHKFKKSELINEINKLTEEGISYQNKLGRENKNYEVAYNTKLIYEGERQFDGLTSKESVIYVWSKERAEVIAVNLEMKSKDKIVEDERIKKTEGVFNNGERWYGYGENKIWEIKRNAATESQTESLNIDQVNAWKGLIYALNNEQKQIVKLGGSSWTKWNSTPLPATMTGMAIDGDIWTLSEGAQVYKFTRGERVDFEMSFKPPAVNPGKIVTSDKVNIVAFINDDKVWIYGKNGKILARLNFGKNEIVDIAIENPKEAILVLAADGNIYRIKNNEIF